MIGSTLEFFPNYNAGRIESPGDWARAREAEGWHGLALSDHFVTMNLAYPHLWVAATEMALATRAIPITSSFGNNLFRSPVEFAQAALTLNRVAKGRFEAGLGAGWIEDEILRIGWRFPTGPERAGSYIEAMQIVRELLQTGRCRFAGKHYRIDIDEPGFAGLASTPPLLVGSAGGPRTLREIPPFVDRLEIQPNASATRGGAVDLVRSAAIEESDVRDAVARVRRVREDLPIGIFALTGAVPAAQVPELRAPFGSGFMARFMGEPESVAQALCDLEGLGFDRVQITEMAPGTLERLRPRLPLRRVPGTT
jgi:alkanesulfonate monooxygenase SsuD/methylene tetrahydromethanopterin reductase-like flavin-dependent oxidoreductase (luciferase family)